MIRTSSTVSRAGPKNVLTSAEEKGDVDAQNIIALCFSSNQLGVAAYNELQNTIFGDVFEVSVEDFDSTLTSIKMTFEPTLFLLHPNIITNTTMMNLILQGSDDQPSYYKYKALRSAAWNEKVTSPLIYNDLKIRARYEELTKVTTVSESILETIRRLEVDLDLEKVRLKQALGALLSYLQETIFQLDQGKILIAAIMQFPIIPYLRMDSSAYSSLQIFSEDFHPNWIGGKGQSKEGFSMYGLFDRTHSVLGRKKLRDWMTKPFCDLPKILERQKGIAFTLQENNHDLLSQLLFNLRHIADIPHILLRIKKVQGSYSDWCKLYTSISNSVTIIDKLDYYKQHLLSNDSDDYSFIENLLQFVNPIIIRNIMKLMSTVINIADSIERKEVIIQEGFDLILDQKRELYSNIENYLYQAAQDILEEYPILEVCSHYC
jgi:DNA mismatch repair ATPase MutS